MKKTLLEPILYHTINGKKHIIKRFDLISDKEFFIEAKTIDPYSLYKCMLCPPKPLPNLSTNRTLNLNPMPLTRLVRASLTFEPAIYKQESDGFWIKTDQEVENG